MPKIHAELPLSPSFTSSPSPKSTRKRWAPALRCATLPPFHACVHGAYIGSSGSITCSHPPALTITWVLKRQTMKASTPPTPAASGRSSTKSGRAAERPRVEFSGGQTSHGGFGFLLRVDGAWVGHGRVRHLLHLSMSLRARMKTCTDLKNRERGRSDDRMWLAQIADR